MSLVQFGVKDQETRAIWVNLLSSMSRARPDTENAMLELDFEKGVRQEQATGLTKPTTTPTEEQMPPSPEHPQVHPSSFEVAKSRLDWAVCLRCRCSRT